MSSKKTVTNVLTIIIYFFITSLPNQTGTSINKYRDEIVTVAGEIFCEKTLNEETIESLEDLLKASDSTSASPESIKALVSRTLLLLRKLNENKSIYSKLALILFKHTNGIEGNKIN